MVRDAPIDFVTDDGEHLAADLAEPTEGPLRASAVIGSAMGVPKKLYAAFSKFLAASGVSVLRFDYRGMGESRKVRVRESNARIVDWAEHDLPSAVRFAKSRAPGKPVLYVGHSMGGQILGRVHAREPVDTALFVASVSAHWRNWPRLRDRAYLALNWYFLIPAAAGLLGYAPTRRVLGGDDLPRGVANDWARYARRRDYFGSSDYQGPLRAYAFTDDTFLAPEPAVRALVALYPRAKSEVRVVKPSDWNAMSIGHFGAFRQAFESTFFAEARDWLFQSAGVA